MNLSGSRIVPSLVLLAALLGGWITIPGPVGARDCPTCPDPTPASQMEYLWPGAPDPVSRSWSEASVESSPTPASTVPKRLAVPSPSPKPAAIVCRGDRLRYRDGGKVITAEGNVRIGYKDVLLTADQATVYVERKEAYASGNVTLTRGDNVIHSDKIRYDFLTEEGILAPGSGFYEPWYGWSETLETEGNQKMMFYGGAASTCDEDEPHYRLEAAELVIYPEDHLVARNVTFYLGDVPILWLPWFRRSLKSDCRGFFLYPGYRGKWGFFFLSGYHWCVPGLSTTFHLDYRQRRGWAYGLDGNFYPGRAGVGEWQTYYLKDEEYENEAEETLEKERYLAEFRYRQPLPYQIGSYIALSYASDSTIRKDFFRQEYDADAQPKSYAYLSRRWKDIFLSLEVQPRVNDFEWLTERLPEAKLQIQEFQISESDFYYQGENSYSYLTKKRPERSSSLYESGRFDTYHRLSYSRKFFGWLNILPSTSLRYDFYSRGPARPSESAPDSDNGSADDPTAPSPIPTPEPSEERDLWRRTFSAGLEVTTDIYGLFPVQSQWLEIDQLRHVITPSVNYIFTDNPTVPTDEIYQFDSIDRIGRTNYFLLKLRNRLQTKRGEGDRGGDQDDEIEGIEEGLAKEEAASKSSWTLVDLIIATPLYTRPDKDNQGQLIGDFDGRLTIQPYSWIGLNLDLAYNSYDNRFLNDTLDLWIRPEDDWWVTFSHNYRYGRDRNQLSAEVYLRINPVWAFQVYSRYDTLRGGFEEESFKIFRDFHCWSASLEYERQEDEDDYSFLLTFWIKAFSQAPLRLSN